MCETGFEEVKKEDLKLLKNIKKIFRGGGYGGKSWTEMMKNEFNLEIEITQRTDIKNETAPQN